MSDARDANHQPGDLSSHQLRLRDFIHPFSKINVDSDPVIHSSPSINQSTLKTTMRAPTNFSLLALLALVSSTAAKMTTVSFDSLKQKTKLTTSRN